MVENKAFSIFKRSKTTAENLQEEEPVFDETCFDFKLSGGPYQTQLIEASATYIKGTSAGMPLPLHCTWYRSTSKVDFRVIEGISGAFYQPNIEDVGCRICVHAVPTSEVEEYEGMPAFQEVGPLQMDPEVEQKVQEQLEKPKAVFEINHHGDKVELQISRESMCLTADDQDIVTTPIDGTWPQVLLDWKSNEEFTLKTSENSVCILSAMDNIQRDVITLLLKLRNGMKHDSLPNDSFMQFNTYVKLDQLHKALEKISSDKEIMANKFVNSEQALDTAQEDLEKMKQDLKSVHAHNTVLTEEVESLSKQIQTYKHESAFLKQEIAWYKKSTQKLERKLSKLESRQDEKLFLAEILQKSQEGDSELADIVQNFLNTQMMMSYPASEAATEVSQIEMPNFSDVISAENEKYEIYKIIIQCHEEEVQKQLILMSNLQQEFEKSQAERNFYKKKWESIQIENDKLLTKLGKNPNETAASNEADIDTLKQEHARELHHLRVELESYKQCMMISKTKFEEELRKRIAIQRPAGKNEQLAGLVNALTMTVTEKDLELTAQKEVNRQLINKVAELEALLAALSMSLNK